MSLLLFIIFYYSAAISPFKSSYAFYSSFYNLFCCYSFVLHYMCIAETVLLTWITLPTLKVNKDGNTLL